MLESVGLVQDGILLNNNNLNLHQNNALNQPNPGLNSDAKGLRSLRSLRLFAPVSLALFRR